MAAPLLLGRRSGAGGPWTRRREARHGGGDSGATRASRDAAVEKEVEGGAAVAPVASDLAGEAESGGSDRSGRRRPPASQIFAREKRRRGRFVAFLRKRTRTFA